MIEIEMVFHEIVRTAPLVFLFGFTSGAVCYFKPS